MPAGRQADKQADPVLVAKIVLFFWGKLASSGSPEARYGVVINNDCLWLIYLLISCNQSVLTLTSVLSIIPMVSDLRSRLYILVFRVIRQQSIIGAICV